MKFLLKGYGRITKKKFYSLVVDKAEKELEEEKTRFNSPAVQKEYQKIKSELEKARVDFKVSGNQSEYEKLQADIRHISNKELAPIQLELTDIRNRVLEEEYLYTKYQTEEHKNKLEKLKKESKQVLAEAEEIKARLAEIQEGKVALTKDIEKYEKELLPFESPLNKLEEKLASLKKKRPSIQNYQLHIPGLNKVDRCKSCHVGIDKNENYSDKHPFKKHPGSYIFLKNHPLKDFGCTVCHEGQGRATTSAEKAHGNVHYWLHPMLLGGLSQANCIKCHERVDDLPGASLIAEGFRLFAVERGCIGCHDVEGVDTVKIGPPLTFVGNKVSYKWLKAWLKDPRAHDEKARMPNFLLSDEEIENIADFLESLSRKELGLMMAADPDVDEVIYQRGRSLYNSSRCVICHPREGKGGAVKSVYAPDLTKVAIKISKDWLARWVKNPREYHPETKMPHFRFTDKEIEDLVAYMSAEFIDWDVLEEEEEESENLKVVKRRIDPASAEKGRKLVKNYGCFGCHHIKGFEKESKVGVELTVFGSKGLDFLDFGVVHEEIGYNWLDWTVAKLENPRQFREGLKMPKFNLTDGEFEALICFLASLKEGSIPIEYFVKASKVEFVPQGKIGKIVKDLNCLVCHRIKDKGGSFAPELTYEGSRVQREWITDFLKAPDILRPLLKQMPKFNLSEEETELVASYAELVLVDDEVLFKESLGEITSGDVEKGKELYQEKGCRVCHQIGPEGGAVGPNLSKVGDRLTKSYIYMHLKDPQRWGESKVAPDYDLTDEELSCLTKYLKDLRAKKVGFLWKNTD
ncbi:MAG: putative cytochrome c [Candidatus Scalindua rubra]|uniref:Putative cytochrome c n=1 Tax=Candidatus Scalindua rubra TaxID=1872076 RepID=A0A1E3X808_9BACT|nr:MAG: putative cytochrome c [Candidatus Scalindua rubra]